MIKAYLQKIVTSEINQAESALKDIYLNFGNLIYNQANRILHDKFQSEEVLNDIILKIWNKAEFLLSLDNPLGYVLTMTYNKAIDYKRIKKEFAIDDVSIYLDQLEAINYKPKDEISKLDIALENLTENDRSIILLRVVYEYTFYEISESLNISYKQARSKFNKAFKLFKINYEKLENQ